MQTALTRYPSVAAQLIPQGEPIALGDRENAGLNLELNNRSRYLDRRDRFAGDETPCSQAGRDL